MSRITSSNARVIGQTFQKVEINGVHRRDVLCETVSISPGVTPSQARIRVPRWLFQDGQFALDDASVVVYARSGPGSYGTPLFRGYIDTDTRTEDARSSTVVVTARSTISILDRVNVTDYLVTPELQFRRILPSGVLSGWTVSGIVRALFSELALASQIRAVISLGSTAALEAAERDLETPDIVLPPMTYRDALARLMEMVGRVQVTERFTNSGTVLDFFPINSSTDPVGIIEMPTLGKGPESGAFGLSIQANRDSKGLRNRVKAYGNFDMVSLTVGTDQSVSGASYLTPAWPNASSYSDVTAAPATAAELAVLENPGRATPGHPLYNPAYQMIFRLFELPECIRRHTIMDRNVMEDTPDSGQETGRPYENQFFHQKLTQSNANRETEGKSGWDTEGTVSTTEWTLVSGVRVINNRYLFFPKPVVGLERTEFSASKGAIMVFRRVHAFASIGVMLRDSALAYDTGRRGRISHADIDPPGLTFTFRNNNIQRNRLGTSSGQLKDASGAGYTFGLRFFDRDANTWTAYQYAGSPFTVRNDSAYLSGLAEAALAERNTRVTDAAVRLPGIWRTYWIGRMVRILNRGIDGLFLQGMGVTFDLINSDTLVRLTNAVPRTVNISGSRSDLAREFGGTLRQPARPSMFMPRPLTDAQRAELHMQREGLSGRGGDSQASGAQPPEIPAMPKPATMDAFDRAQLRQMGDSF